MNTTRTDYENLSPRTLATIRRTSTISKVRKQIDQEFARRGMWNISGYTA